MSPKVPPDIADRLTLDVIGTSSMTPQAAHEIAARILEHLERIDKIDGVTFDIGDEISRELANIRTQAQNLIDLSKEPPHIVSGFEYLFDTCRHLLTFVEALNRAYLAAPALDTQKLALEIQRYLSRAGGILNAIKFPPVYRQDPASLDVYLRGLRGEDIDAHEYIQVEE